MTAPLPIPMNPGCMFTPDPKTIGQRVSLQRKMRGWSQRDLADKISKLVGKKVHQPSIAQLENDEVDNPHFLSALAEALEVSRDYLEKGTPPEKKRHSEILSSACIRIPEYDIDAGAGNGVIFSESNIIEEIEIPLQLLREVNISNKKKLAFISVRGDSMEPTLKDGQKVLIDYGQNSVTHPAVYMLWDGTGIVIKRVQSLPGEKLLISSDNQNYRTYEVQADQIEIKGRALWALQKL